MNIRRMFDGIIIFLSAIAMTISPAVAGTVFFCSDGGAGGAGSVEAVLPLAKLGSLTLPRGRIMIKGNTAEVSEIPEWQFDRRRVLVGQVLDTRVSSHKAGSIISGVMFFTGGEWLGYFDNPLALETVNAGAVTVSGRIRSIADGTVTIRTLSGNEQTLPLSAVVSIHSPRAFHFSIPASLLCPSEDGDVLQASAQTALVSPTATPFRLAVLSRQVRNDLDDGDIPTRKLVAIGTMLSCIEIAQLVPYMVIPLYQSKISHEMLRREFYSLTRGENSPQANLSTNLLLPP